MNETAYYYPAPYWVFEESDWVKSLLLFFDDIAILLPNYMHGRNTAADPTLAEPLEDRGLLRVLDPNDWVDQEVAGKLAETIIELLANGVFDDLPETEYFAEMSQSRIGYGADVKLAKSVVVKLQTKGLARPSEDGVSIPLHPDVRTTILVILAQLSRVAGKRRGMTIHPVTNCHEAVADLTATLSRESMPSRDRIITLDLEPVTFDLATIPLDEVLQFRAQHQNAYRAYMRDVRGFMSELADIDSPVERETPDWSYPGLADGLSVAIQSTARATSLEVFSKFIGERYPAGRRSSISLMTLHASTPKDLQITTNSKTSSRRSRRSYLETKDWGLSRRLAISC